MNKWLLPLAAGMLISAGCTSQSMKGTPFYSGDYQKGEGPAADRINLWPLLYYRDPALSVLWPIMEFSPEHQAIRPVYSVYDLNTDYAVYNVLWPIARFESGTKKNRFFPVYWGEEYFNVVPLYWHEGDPRSGEGHDALIPLWIWQKYEDGYSLHLAWPFYARQRFGDYYAWRLWPFYGMKQSPSEVERSVAWPLIRSYTNETRAGHWILPVYGWTGTEERSRFLSLPYSRSLTKLPDERSWDLALPLWYRSWEGERSTWVVMPTLSWGNRSERWSDSWHALGLGRYAASPDGRYHHVLPFYSYASDQEAKAFYTLPWWWKKRADGSGFNALMPVYYHGYSDLHSSFYSLPWLMQRRDDGSGWHATFPLYYRGYSPGHSSFYSLPWFCRHDADGSGWHTTIPLYYRRRTSDTSSFYCPLWMSESHSDGTSWKAAFPVYYSAASTNGSIMITPLYARKRHGDGSLAWRCYIPFVYVNEDYDAHFMTPLGGRWRMGNRQSWIALPLLSGGGAEDTSGRNIYLAGLAGQRWNQHGSSHYVMPIYYRAAEAGTFVSLPYSTWAEAERQYTVIPPLLSGWYRENELSRGLLAAGLAGYRTGGADSYHYLLPFYYSAAQDGTFYSIPYARWQDGDRINHFVLPLLSTWYTGDDSSGGTWALALAGYRKGGAFSYSYLFPFYYRSPEENAFITLPYARWESGERRYQLIPLLLSGWSATAQTSDVRLLGGLCSWSRGSGGMEGSHLLPLYMWSKDKYFYSAVYGTNSRKTYYATPLAGKYESGSGKAGNWILPLYWHRRSLSNDSVRTYYFPLGYYNRNNDHTNHGFLGIYDYDHRTHGWSDADDGAGSDEVKIRSRTYRFLLSLGKSHETWTYKVDGAGHTNRPATHSKEKRFLPVWNRRVEENHDKGSSLDTSSLLWILHDTRHEREWLDNEHDYFRRRILWRLYHYEKLNGDASIDVFPAITVDSYRNGYRKISVLWRLFRYENDPESGKSRLDILFVPLKR